MKYLMLIFVLISIEANACNNVFDCDSFKGERCYNINTLNEYSGFDNAGVCLNKNNVQKRSDTQGCCSYHGGIHTGQLKVPGDSVLCADYTTSPTCVWKSRF